MACVRVVCIDPGITSVGLFGASLNTGDRTIVNIFLCETVDMRAAFGKAGHLHSYIDAFFAAYAETLAGADLLLVERQPFASAGFPLELLLRERFGEKCTFLHPATLLKHYGTAGFQYDARKRMNVQMATAALQHWASKHLPGAGDALSHVRTLDRQHDCLDACLFFMYYAVSPPLVAPLDDSDCDGGGGGYATTPSSVASSVAIASPPMTQHPSEPASFADFIEQFRRR